MYEIIMGYKKDLTLDDEFKFIRGDLNINNRNNNLKYNFYKILTFIKSIK